MSTERHEHSGDLLFVTLQPPQDLFELVEVVIVDVQDARATAVVRAAGLRKRDQRPGIQL
jgi:hypothetical protein